MAAKTSAFYAVAPFIGAFLSFVLLKESLTLSYVVALLIMVIGTVFAVLDTLFHEHTHKHTHTFTYTHDGTSHSHTVTHSHYHKHYVNEKNICTGMIYLNWNVWFMTTKEFDFPSVMFCISRI